LSIGANMFVNCPMLTTVMLPNNGEISIGQTAFYGCSNLTNITIPASVTSIGSQAFRNCVGITGIITIPTSVTSIDGYAFGGWTASQTIHVEGYANQAAADAAWGADWRATCNADIKYWNGSSYQ